jgi:hypothetical protein
LPELEKKNFSFYKFSRILFVDIWIFNFENVVSSCALSAHLQFFHISRILCYVYSQLNNSSLSPFPLKYSVFFFQRSRLRFPSASRKIYLGCERFHVKDRSLIITTSQLSTLVCYKRFSWTFLIQNLTVQKFVFRNSQRTDTAYWANLHLVSKLQSERWQPNQKYLLYAQVILRVAFLVATLSVRPRQGREQAFYWLLRKHQFCIPLLLIISLFLLTVNYFSHLFVLMLAIADVCYRTQYNEQVVEGSERSKCFLPDSYRNLLPFRHSTPLVPHLAAKITCLCSRCRIDFKQRFILLAALIDRTVTNSRRVRFHAGINLIQFNFSLLWSRSSNCLIWGSHGGVFEDGCLLGCSAV